MQFHYKINNSYKQVPTKYNTRYEMPSVNHLRDGVVMINGMDDVDG